MLTEEEINEAEKIGKKHEVVQKLLDFWGRAQVDGQSALRIALNEKLLEISASIPTTNASDNENKTFERIDKILAAMSKLPKEEKPAPIEEKVEPINEKHKGKAVI